MMVVLKNTGLIITKTKKNAEKNEMLNIQKLQKGKKFAQKQSKNGDQNLDG